MLTEVFLEKIGFEADDIDFILANDIKYKDTIEPIAKEYMSGLQIMPFVPYEGNGRQLSLEKANLFIKQVQEKIPEENQYVLNLLAWLHCVPYLHTIYRQFHINENIFYETMKDLSYKAKECKNVYGVCGFFVNWFFLFFELKAFSMGRLQFEVYPFDYDEYVFESVHLKKRDRVYFCHIPSSGRLTQEQCMESFQKAYDFFEADRSGDVIPIISHTWLLYQPYIDKVFPPNSNLKKFANLFEVTDTTSTGNDFYDCWRVFNKIYEGTAKGLPADNTLRRNFIQYIEAGGDFGIGHGIILYNGKTKKIINH